MKDNCLVLGFYIEPHVWMAEDEKHIDFRNISDSECLEIVFAKSFPNGIEVCAQRQGFIIAAFPEELLSIRISEIKTANLLPMSAALFTIDFFNSLVFLLYDQTYKHYNKGYQSIKQAIKVSDLWRWYNVRSGNLVSVATQQPGPILNQSEMRSIDMAPYELGKSIGQLTTHDKQFRMPQPIEPLEKALDAMVGNDFQLNWQLLALLNKAIWSIQNAEFAEAHVLCWSVAEKLLGIEWANYINGTSVSVGDSDKKTINRKRKDHLNSSEYEASKRIEILELAKVISYDLFENLHAARKTRNKWIHSLESVNQEDCRQCYFVARGMMSRKLKYNIEHPGAFYIQDEHMRAPK